MNKVITITITILLFYSILKRYQKHVNKAPNMEY